VLSQEKAMSTTTMRAVINSKYGSAEGLQLGELDKPAVNADGVLIRVRAVSINPLDMHFMTGLPYVLRLQEGLRQPRKKVLGVDVAGQVVAVGEDVTEFQPGDEVFGHRSSALAEYVSGPAADFIVKPGFMTFEQAAAIPVAGFTALQGLRDHAEVKAGQRVLINGGCGGVGTFAVQIAKALGAAEVTGVCSTANVELVRSLGADRVIDYTKDDFARTKHRYDVVLDVAGNRPLSAYRRVLTATGTLVLIGAGRGQWIGPVVRPLRAILMSRFVRQRLTTFIAKPNRPDLIALTELIGEGKIAPVVDRVYPLSETADAMRYLQTGHARGKIIIAV
jgi:NADPH:quinone reductase-like Zn-dependent oxidoreductase